MFAQCITAMAHHQYLELEGGHKLVEFIVRQCAVSDDEVGYAIQLFRETLLEKRTKLPKPIPKGSMGRRIELLHVLNTL